MPVTAGSPGPDDSEDLSTVLEHVARNTLAPARARTANNPATRQFLEIGLELLRADLLEHTGPDLDGTDRSKLFEALSRDRILNRAADQDTDGTKLLSDAMFRHRWQHKNRYTEDLISYLFRLPPQYRHLDEMERQAEQLVGTVSFGELIRTLAAAEMHATRTDPLMALQAILQNALPRHPRVRAFVQAHYDLLLPRWAAVYERVAEAYGLRIKPGRTSYDMALLFNSVIEGTLSRARVEESDPVLSDGENVLAGAIIAMLPALLEPMPDDIDSLYAVETGR